MAHVFMGRFASVRAAAVYARIFIIMFFGAFFHSCGPVQATFPFQASDLRPPEILSFSVVDGHSVSIEFDEAAGAKDGSLFLYGLGEGGLPPDSAQAEGTCLRMRWNGEFAPGREYRLEGRVADAGGNSLGFFLGFFGFNPRLPQILINEVRTDSSSPQCDAVELFVKRGGNLGGLSLCSGVKGDFDWRYVFPGIEVGDGEYVVLHLKADETGAGRDETGADLGESGGTDASGTGRDLWYPGQEGLTKANGAVCLYENPAGALLDACLYSDRRADSDAEYAGFGSEKMRLRVQAVVADSGWLCSGGSPRPEDCVPSAGTTETRTLCRDPRSSDTDSRSDWHVAQTRGASLGRANPEARYDPARAKRGSTAKP